MANAASAGMSGLSGAAMGTAVAPGLGTIAGGAIGLLGGLFGGGDDDSAESMQKAIDAINAVGPAPDLSDPVVIKSLQQAGVLTPELLQKLNLNADNKTTLIENPEGKQQQQYALNALKQLSQNGLSEADRASFNQLRQQTGADQNAKINQLAQQQQMRGQGSAGNTLAAQLASIQNSTQNASADADRLAQAAVSARQGALANFGNLAGSMRNTDIDVGKYNNSNDIARQQFLDQNSVSRQNSNVAAMNAANQANLQRQQGVSDTNIGNQNTELLRQNQAKMDKYNADLKKAQALSGVFSGNANMQQKQAENSAQSNANLWSGVGNLSGKALDWSGIFKPSASTPSTGVAGLGGSSSNSVVSRD